MITKILVIDDNLVNRTYLKLILSKEGFEVLEAKTGADGRALALEALPDLIMLDVEMPGEHGFITCEKLKKNIVTSTIPVMFISSLNDIASKVTGLALDAVDYITKPFYAEEVIARVKLHVRLNKAQKEIIEFQKEKLDQLASAQEGILIDPSDMPDARFNVFYKSKMESGGDFYDVLNMGNEVYGYICADVSGHDMGATLATAAFKALVHQNAGSLYSPRETFQIVNNVLLSALKDGQYLSAIYALLNRNKNKLTVVSAGHPPMILLPLGGEAYAYDLTGDLLGLFQDVEFIQHDIEVNEGDRFFLYTDGLIECFDGKDITRTEGMEHLLKAINDNKGETIEHILDIAVDTIIPDLSDLSDDIFLMGVEV